MVSIFKFIETWSQPSTRLTPEAPCAAGDRVPQAPGGRLQGAGRCPRAGSRAARAFLVSFPGRLSRQLRTTGLLKSPTTTVT